MLHKCLYIFYTYSMYYIFMFAKTLKFKLKLGFLSSRRLQGDPIAPSST